MTVSDWSWPGLSGISRGERERPARGWRLVQQHGGCEREAEAELGHKPDSVTPLEWREDMLTAQSQLSTLFISEYTE